MPEQCYVKKEKFKMTWVSLGAQWNPIGQNCSTKLISFAQLSRFNAVFTSAARCSREMLLYFVFFPTFAAVYFKAARNNSTDTLGLYFAKSSCNVLIIEASGAPVPHGENLLWYSNTKLLLACRQQNSTLEEVRVTGCGQGHLWRFHDAQFLEGVK